MIEIRQIDRERYRGLIDRWVRAFFVDKDSDTIDHVWGAYVGSELAGVAGYQSCFDGAVAFLNFAAVSARWRGRGLHKLMTAARLEHVWEAGHGRAVSYTRPDNFASVNSLIGCGFRLYRPEVWDGVELGSDSPYLFWQCANPGGAAPAVYRSGS